MKISPARREIFKQNIRALLLAHPRLHNIDLATNTGLHRNTITKLVTEIKNENQEQMRNNMETKEQLIKENAELSDRVDKLINNDEIRRIEFARAFNWTKQGSSYNYDPTEYRKPTWAEIFVQLGRLLETHDSESLRVDFENLAREVGRLGKVITKEDKQI